MIKLFLILALILPNVLFASEKLSLVTSLDALEATEYIKEFEKDTGIKVEWIRLSAGEVVARIKAEGKNQTQSVWFGGPISDYVAAKNDGLLKPYKPQSFLEIPAKFRDKEGYYTGIYFGAIVIISNNQCLNRQQLKIPNSWQDLLKPEYKGHIVIAYPYTSGTGYTTFAGLIYLMGIDGAIDYWKKLDPSIHHYTKSGAAPIIEVGLGESCIGIVFAQDAIRKGIARGFPITISYPEEGAPMEIGGVALIEGAPNEKEAKIFIDWITSAKGQNYFKNHGRIPLNPNATPPKDVKGAKDIKIINMDLVEAGKNRKSNVDRWRRELKQ